MGAKGQEVDATSLNKILPKGFTKVCEDGEGPEPKSLSKRQVQTARDAPPCWTLVDEDFDKTQCSSFENTCDTRKPYVGSKQNTICIKDQDGAWALEPVRFNDCGGSECCRFEFVNQ